MNIKTRKEYGWWYAIDEDTYDGADDGNNEQGCGRTEQEAIDDLKEKLNEFNS